MGDRGGNALLRVQDPVRASSYFDFRSVLTVTPGKYLRAKIGEDRDVWTSEKKCGQYVLLHKALHQQKPDGTSSKHSARLAGLCASCSGAVARWLVFTGPNLRLRGARLFQIEYRDRDYQTHVYFWNNPAALRKQRRNAKPLCVWRQSLRRRYSYGAFLEKHEKLDDAIAQYRQALQIDPRFVDAHIDLASELFANGELQEAKAHYLE